MRLIGHNEGDVVDCRALADGDKDAEVPTSRSRRGVSPVDAAPVEREVRFALCFR